MSDSIPRRIIAAPLLAPRMTFLLATLALVLFGLVMVFSASSVSAINDDASPTWDLVKQVAFAGAGIIGGLIAFFLPSSFWRGRATYVLVGISVALTIATALVGTEVYGAKRWIVIGGGVSFQASEFCKIAYVIMTAKLFADLREGIVDSQTFLVQILVTVVCPVLLLYYLQSDMGTTMIIAVGILAVLWLGEVPSYVFVALVLFVGVFGVYAIFSSGYRSDRFLFLNPWNDGENGYGKGYQLIHSYWAFAEGGLFGAGLGNSHAKYQYLTQADNDFIFAVIGEELGLLGALVVVLLFLALLVAGISISKQAENQFAYLLSGALVAMLVFQAVLNMGSAVGALPTTGKPLPFVSSGGSSLIASLLSVGIIFGVTKDAGASPQARRNNLRVVRSTGSSAPGLSSDDFRAYGTRGSSFSSSLGGSAPMRTSGSSRRSSFDLGTVHRRDR